jgi:eukaryotic-like serine/threonine-protein kinase
MFKDLIAFLKSKLFLKNLALAIGVVILFFTSVAFFLSKYTRHGEYIVLQNLSNKKIADAEDLLKSEELNYIIIDSVYVENSPPGLVINQNPYPGAHVKRGRNIYLYITSTLPPLVEMPDLMDKSLRQARNLLDNAGLKTGQVRMVVAPLSGFVLSQTYKDKTIQPGTKIPKGSVINLEVGRSSAGDSL